VERFFIPKHEIFRHVLSKYVADFGNERLKLNNENPCDAASSDRRWSPPLRGVDYSKTGRRFELTGAEPTSDPRAKFRARLRNFHLPINGRIRYVRKWGPFVIFPVFFFYGARKYFLPRPSAR